MITFLFEKEIIAPRFIAINVLPSPEMVEALTFYTDLQRCALPGPQFWRGARESYQYDSFTPRKFQCIGFRTKGRKN